MVSSGAAEAGPEVRSKAPDPLTHMPGGAWVGAMVQGSCVEVPGPPPRLRAAASVSGQREAVVRSAHTDYAGEGTAPDPFIPTCPRPPSLAAGFSVVLGGITSCLESTHLESRKATKRARPPNCKEFKQLGPTGSSGALTSDPKGQVWQLLPQDLHLRRGLAVIVQNPLNSYFCKRGMWPRERC